MHVHPERHSLLSLPHPFFIPGQRFRELYYWDSYWVIKGLLVSGMHRSAEVTPVFPEFNLLICFCFPYATH